MSYSPWDDLRSRPNITCGPARLPQGRAWWFPDEKLIALDDRLDQVGRRVALAHELVHVDRGDVCIPADYDDSLRLTLRSEAACHAEAARRLIDIRDLATAFQIWGEGNLDAVADEMWVDLPTLCARLDHLHPTERGLIRRALDAKEDAA